jgi:hypothetical protein
VFAVTSAAVYNSRIPSFAVPALFQSTSSIDFQQHKAKLKEEESKPKHGNERHHPYRFHALLLLIIFYYIT